MNSKAYSPAHIIRANACMYLCVCVCVCVFEFYEK